MVSYLIFNGYFLFIDVRRNTRRMKNIVEELSNDELTQIIHNWRQTKVLTVHEAYRELSKRKLHAPDLLPIIMEIRLQNNLTEFCNAYQFSKIEDFVKSYYETQKSEARLNHNDTPDEFGLCWE